MSIPAMTLEQEADRLENRRTPDGEGILPVRKAGTASPRNSRMVGSRSIFRAAISQCIMAAMMSASCLLVTGLRADEIARPPPAGAPGLRGKTLSFPSGQWTGNLYVEPESDPGWDPESVTLPAEWEYFSAARGDVLVPEDRQAVPALRRAGVPPAQGNKGKMPSPHVKLWVQLALSPRESATLVAQNPLAHRLTIADRTRKDPNDLAGLSDLDPNGLFWLSVSSSMYLRAGADPRIFEPIRRLTGLRILSLSSTGVTDEGLEYLRPLHSLTALELTQAGIGNRGLAVLKGLPALEHLYLNTGLTDAGLKQVAQVSSLRWLRMATGNIQGPGLVELARLPRLERLCIHAPGDISDRHIKYLEGLTRLKSLTLWGICDNLTDASLVSIGKLKNLEELHFIRTNPRFTPAGVAHLKALTNLKKVDFAAVWCSPEGERYGDVVARQLAANHPNLESIKGISFLSAEGMKTLATLRNLKCLGAGLKDRRQGYYGPTGIPHLAGLGLLEELSISSGDALSDADLVCLEPLACLRELSLFGSSVSDRGLASIGKLKQLERLNLSSVARSGLNQLNGLSSLQYLQVAAYRSAAIPGPADAGEPGLDLSGLKKMRDMNLSGLPLQDSDLAFLEHLPLLKNLMIQPDSDAPLAGASLRHLRELPELNRLRVSGLLDCGGEDLAHLNALPKLRTLHLSGDITDAALASLTGPVCLESLYVDTDEPISKQTVADLTRSHPLIEYVHISELPTVQTRPVSKPTRTGVSPPRVNQRSQPNSRRRR